jgi:hypothetical protein
MEDLYHSATRSSHIILLLYLESFIIIHVIYLQLAIVVPRVTDTENVWRGAMQHFKEDTKWQVKK